MDMMWCRPHTKYIWSIHQNERVVQEMRQLPRGTAERVQLRLQHPLLRLLPRAQLRGQRRLGRLGAFAHREPDLYPRQERKPRECILTPPAVKTR